MTELPLEPIEQLERLAALVDRIPPRLEGTLGQLATEAASPDAIAWVNRLEEVASNLYRTMDALFEQTVGVPRELAPEPDIVLEPAPDPTPETEGAILDTVQLDLLRYLADNPYSRFEIIHKEVPTIQGWTTTDFRNARKDIVTRLSAADINLEFDVEGKTRGAKYAIVIEDDASIERFKTILHPPVSEEPEVAVEVPVEQFEPVVLNGNGSHPELTEVPPAPERSSVLLPDDVLLEFIAGQPQQVGIARIASELYETPELPSGTFHALNNQLKRLTAEGRLDRHPHHQRFITGGRPFVADTDDPGNTTANQDFERMLSKTKGLKKDPRAFKPAQRGRRDGGKRRR